MGKAVNEAKNPQLAGVLPKTYQIFDSTLLKDLLKKVSEIPATAEGDTFGRKRHEALLWRALNQ